MYTVISGQFQVGGRADLGTVEGMLLSVDKKPVALMFDVLDRRFYGAEKDRMLSGTYKAARDILKNHATYESISLAWVDSSETRFCLPL